MILEDAIVREIVATFYERAVQYERDGYAVDVIQDEIIVTVPKDRLAEFLEQHS